MTDEIVCILPVIRVLIAGLVERRPLDPEVAGLSLSVFTYLLHLMFITFEEPADCFSRNHARPQTKASSGRVEACSILRGCNPRTARTAPPPYLAVLTGTVGYGRGVHVNVG